MQTFQESALLWLWGHLYISRQFYANYPNIAMKNQPQALSVCLFLYFKALRVSEWEIIWSQSCDDQSINQRNVSQCFCHVMCGEVFIFKSTLYVYDNIACEDHKRKSILKCSEIYKGHETSKKNRIKLHKQCWVKYGQPQMLG